jgi:hypothetical protein
MSQLLARGSSRITALLPFVSALARPTYPTYSTYPTYPTYSTYPTYPTYLTYSTYPPTFSLATSTR